MSLRILSFVIASSFILIASVTCVKKEGELVPNQLERMDTWLLIQVRAKSGQAQG